MAKFDDIYHMVDGYYTTKLKENGATHKGVDWNSKESQYLRFQQLMKIHRKPENYFTLNDLGCGFGSMVEYLQQDYPSFTYTGYDLSEAMVEVAQQTYSNHIHVAFTTHVTHLKKADYTVASGIFNVKQTVPSDYWLDYLLTTVRSMWESCEKGIAFNCLTSYSDVEYMRENLYYCDPLKMFDFCKRSLSREVALLHDYGLYEFTVLVRKE